MRKDIESVETWVNDMVENDKDRNDLFDSIDAMFHGDWELPATLSQKGMQKMVSLVPHDALNAATKAYSGLTPRFRVKAMGPGEIERDRARQMSDALKWHFFLADQKRRSLWDIVHCSMRYDAIAVRVEHIPFLYEGNKRAKKHKGIFDLEVFHPKYVHCEEGKFGIEKLSLITNHSLEKVLATWRNRKNADAKSIAKLEEQLAENSDLRFTMSDATYWKDDSVWQTVYGNVNTDESVSDPVEAAFVLYHKKLEIPFINWAVEYGGSNIEAEDYSVHPLLAPLVWTGAWENLNIKKSLLNDEVIKYAESPRRVNKTWNREGVTVDYEHGSDINLNPQESSDVQQPPQIDSALLQLVKDAEGEIQTTTIASILYNLANTMGDAPYSSMSAVMQNTLSSLTPQKKLAEAVLEQVGCLFLEWSSYTGKPITAYRTQAFGNQPVGSDIVITPDDYDLDNLFISVELRADNPMDEMQRVNMGVLKNQQLKIPLSDVYDELGYEDPDGRMKMWMEEKLDETEFGKTIQLSQAEAQLQIQGAQMQMQMQMQQAAQAQQQMQSPPEQGGGYPSNTQGMSPAFDNMQGQGFNPNAGGATPMTGASPMGREQLTGETVGGGPTAE